jgi:hypothetical protein
MGLGHLVEPSLVPGEGPVRVREQVGRKSSPYDSEDKEVSRTNLAESQKMRFYSTALVMMAIVMMLAMTLLITTS